jgi:Pentapeptide repeats (8 copies)
MIEIRCWDTREVLAQVDADSLCGADMRGLELRMADLRGADLRGADLRGAGLTLADLRDADLRGADPREAQLANSNAGGVDLREADLRGADLRGASLVDADLGGADLRGADVCGTDLRRAQWRGGFTARAEFGLSVPKADFTRVVGLRASRGPNADFRGAVYNSETRWPLFFSPAGQHCAERDNEVVPAAGPQGTGTEVAASDG